MENHYFKTKLIKMGIWSLLPADVDNWHGQDGSRYFKEYFGLDKGLLLVEDIPNQKQHCYTPEPFFKKLHDRIDEINSQDYKALEKILNKFYPLKDKAKKEISKINPKDFGKITNEELVEVYWKNRDWAHLITVYDQFGWLGEEYWTPIFSEILTKKLHLEKGSAEYNNVLFTLTKPEEISTTLEEKRAVLNEAILFKEGKADIKKSAKKLTEDFAWMPVFTFGTPWDEAWYEKHIREVSSGNLDDMKREYDDLLNYKEIRNKGVDEIVNKYKIEKKDLQKFIDFGLALDARNEAEYITSFAGFYLLPIYNEISKRLNIPVNQVRILYEDEIILALRGKIDPVETIKAKGDILAYGYDEKMEKRINFSPEESKKLFAYAESKVISMQGNDEYKGTCASQGKATGIARIIPSPTENHRVNEGDILITYATTVDYLPAMKKAAAIVTEVGGLTCHAAVVSREFGIPCVVALKNAMKNFKDGDMIEVDADKGIVRLVKNSE